MTALVPSITEEQILTGFRLFLLDITPDGFEVFVAQNNRVPEPNGPDFIIMTPKSRARLATNVDDWDKVNPNPGAKTIKHNARFDLQLDIHGPSGSDVASVIAAVFVDDFGRDALAATPIAPLYASDGNQMPFINGEQQYENRWVMTLSAQIKPTVSTPAQFAASLVPVVNPTLGG